jgi:hypothetical protein
MEKVKVKVLIPVEVEFYIDADGDPSVGTITNPTAEDVVKMTELFSGEDKSNAKHIAELGQWKIYQLDESEQRKMPYETPALTELGDLSSQNDGCCDLDSWAEVYSKSSLESLK